VWTNGTTRATALAYQDGRLVKSGAATRLYLGTIYINASGGQTDDADVARNVWNYYSRMPRKVRYTPGDVNWTVDTVTWRPCNNNTSYRIGFTVGVAEDVVNVNMALLVGYLSNGEYAYFGLGLDVTNAISNTMNFELQSPLNADTLNHQALAAYNEVPAAGYHFLQMIESIGDGPVAVYVSALTHTSRRSGIYGFVWG